MYRNPANYNGDLSDYNSLKNQINNSEIIKKYSSKKLKTEPTELQKYYEYLTYQQPILDEINYTAQKLKDENIKKQKEDFEFLEKLKEEREKKMKGVVDKTETNIEKERIKETLFEPQSKSYDLTPSFQTENELEFDIMDKEYKNYIDGIMLDLDAGKPINKKNKLLLKDVNNALFYNQPLLLEDKATQNKKKYKKALQKYGLSTNISDIMDRPLIKLPPKPTKKQQNIDFYTNIAFDLPIKSNLQRQDIKNKEPIILGRRKISDTNSSIASQANTELAIIPTKKGKVGRPTGSKNKPKNTLDIRPTTLNLFR
jgi:hypothetical protein